MAKQFNLVTPDGKKQPLKLKTMTPKQFVERNQAQPRKPPAKPTGPTNEPNK